MYHVVRLIVEMAAENRSPRPYFESLTRRFYEWPSLQIHTIHFLISFIPRALVISEYNFDPSRMANLIEMSPTPLLFVLKCAAVAGIGDGGGSMTTESKDSTSRESCWLSISKGSGSPFTEPTDASHLAQFWDALLLSRCFFTGSGAPVSPSPSLAVGNCWARAQAFDRVRYLVSNLLLGLLAANESERNVPSPISVSVSAGLLSLPLSWVGCAARNLVAAAAFAVESIPALATVERAGSILDSLSSIARGSSSASSLLCRALRWGGLGPVYDGYYGINGECYKYFI